MDRKYRHEYKFEINEMQMAELTCRLKNLVPLDKNASEDGRYHIRSVYFDDYMDTCMKENAAGTDPRSKYRIRIYNCSDNKITLERKSKRRGMTLKEAASLTRGQFECIMAGKSLPLHTQAAADYPPVLKQFLILMMTKRMRPKTIVEYERVPFTYHNGNVRITFDKNIESSKDFANFFERDILKYPIMSKGIHILEVKYDEYLPSFIKNNLELGTLRPTSFSKYYLSRLYTVPMAGGTMR